MFAEFAIGSAENESSPLTGGSALKPHKRPSGPIGACPLSASLIARSRQTGC